MEESANPSFSSSSSTNPNTISSLNSQTMWNQNASTVQSLPLLPQPSHVPLSLVRAADLGPADEKYFRDMVRQTRIIYDGLRVSMSYKEEKSIEESEQRRHDRSDLWSASTMCARSLWLNLDKRIIGSIPGVKVGDVFIYLRELSVVGLHGQHQAGIDYIPINQSPTGEPIATSIVIYEGSEDNSDAGHEIIYTGKGGNHKFDWQVENQKLEGGNLALERSYRYGLEIRIVRGLKCEGSLTGRVYVYDGLYRILACWYDTGRSEFGVYKYKLARIENQPEMGSVVLKYVASLREEILSSRRKGCLSLDISKGKEKVPIVLVNDIDNSKVPLDTGYLEISSFPSYVYLNDNGSGCKCLNKCDENCPCTIKNGGEFVYDQNGILIRGKPLIFECGVHCGCPPSCRNRVSQTGIKKRLEIFRSSETTWGVRSLDLIQAGSFICEYAGVVFNKEQVGIMGTSEYNFVYPKQFSERWAEWGDFSLVDTNYVRPKEPSIPALDFAVELSKMRNVGTYVSQSSSPNTFVQYVLHEHNNMMFPHLMLFALENIPPMREITLDYGVAEEVCGKIHCRDNKDM